MDTPKTMQFCLEPMTFLRHRFQKTSLKLLKRTLLCEERRSKFIVVLIHQAVGFGVSTTAARWKLVVASAMGNEACARGGEDDEDVLSTCQTRQDSYKAFGLSWAYGNESKDPSP